MEKLKRMLWLLMIFAFTSSITYAANSSFKIKTSGSTVFTQLKSQQTISGPFELSMDFSDSKIAKVELKINQVSVSTYYNAPYLFKGTSKSLINGLNFIEATAYDKNNKALYKKEVYCNGLNDRVIQARAPRVTPTYPVTKKPIYKSGYIPVLMYHNIPQVVHDSLSSSHVQKDLFKKQLEVLLKNKYTPITFYDLYKYQQGEGGLPEKPFIVTFDDGYLDNYTEAFPILLDLKVPATMFVGTAFIGVQTTNKHFLWSDAKKMEESGYIDIQSHTNGHEAMDKLNETQVKYQMATSFEIIEQKLGKRDVKVLAYPQFRNTSNSIKWVKETGCQFQITNLAKKGSLGNQTTDIKRIHMRNDMTPEDLLVQVLTLTN